MAKKVPHDNIRHARAFLEKFGIGDSTVTIDMFDMFIIDRGLAEDPGTTDTKTNVYKGFVQQRNSARHAINNAAAWLNGDSFKITVNKDKEKRTHYNVQRWGDASQDFARDITRQIGVYTASRINNLNVIQGKAATMQHDNPDDHEMAHCMLMLDSLSGHAIKMQAKIAGLLKQYDTAYLMIKGQADELLKLRGEVER